MRKSAPYNIIGVICLSEAVIAIIGWTNAREHQVLEEEFVKVHIYYPLAPALPYLALIACVLGFLCFTFGYLESVKESTRLVK